ncbi:MAG TPA: hypothetical protein VF459_14445 [Caulobacteraceae bacterium]
MLEPPPPLSAEPPSEAHSDVDAAAAAPDPDEVMRARHRAMLEAVAQMSLSLTAAYHAKAMTAVQSAQTPEETNAAAGLGRAFNQSARTMRQTLALETRTADHSRRHRETEQKARAAEAEERAEDAAVRRALVGHAVQDAIEADPRPQPERENLLAKLNEFLDMAEDQFFLDFSIGQAAQLLCQGYKVDVDLALWQDKKWALNEAMTRTPGSPFATWRRADDPLAQPP